MLGFARFELRVVELEHITGDEFMKDPAGAMKRAEQNGSMVVTDDHGEPVIFISCPNDEPPWID